MNIISTNKLQNFILQLIATEQYKEILNNQSYTSKEYEAGFIQGLCWTGIYASQLSTYIGDTYENKTNK